MNLATMTAAPTILTVGDRTYRVGPLRYRELGVIQRYLDETCRSPLKVAEAEVGANGLPAEEKAAILAEGRKAARGWTAPQVGADQRWIDALFASPEGIVFFLNVLFSKHQSFTADDLDHVMAHVGPKQIRPLFLIAMEEPVDPDPALASETSDPKEVAAPSTT